MADFLGQLASVELRYEELTHLLSDPAVIGDSQRYTGLMKEYNNLGPLVECWRKSWSSPPWSSSSLASRWDPSALR